MKLSNMTTNQYDEPTISITLTGYHEIYRFAHHMEYGQVEFGHAGRKIIDRLKRRCNRGAWNEWVGPLRSAEKAIYGRHKNDAAPTVWDGTTEALEAIRAALKGKVDGVLVTHMTGERRDVVIVHSGAVLSGSRGCSVQVVGDAVVILSPVEEDDG